MSVGPQSSRGLALAIALVLVAGGCAILVESAPARAAGVTVDTSSSLAITATAPFTFVSSTYEQLPTNTTINVTFTDADTIAHTFSILDRQGWVIPSSADLGSLFDTYGFLNGPYGINASGPGTFTGSFQSPAAGWYEFVCLEAGHFQSGMYGFIAFGENLPANLTVTAAPTGPGAGVFIISGTIVALVVIALVLGFVVGRRKGSELEMPPERLGYPEPSAPAPAPAPAAPPLPPEPPQR
jgi:plastocyanin